MKKLLSIFLFVFILSCSAQKEEVKFRILHMNDTHSKNKEFVKVSQDKTYTNRYGGASRRKTFIENYKNTNDNVIVMHAGDTIAGSVFSIVYSGLDEVQIMNDIGVDISTLGNHEFDFGFSQLDKIMRSRNFPTIACNVNFIGTTNRYLEPYITTNINGVNIAVVGVVQSEKRNIIDSLDILDIEDEVVSLKNLLDEVPLKNTNDILILLSHAGFDIDKKIAIELPNVFDIIVGGHTHTLLKEPTFINDTMIVQAGEYGEYIGTIDVKFKNNKYSSSDYKLVRLDESIKEDEGMLAMISNMQIEVDNRFNIAIATLGENLLDDDVRSKSVALGNFVADAVESSQESIDIALVNSGSLRASLYSGNVTLGNIYEFFPFDNLIVLTTIDGKLLKQVLELSASKRGEGGFMQVSKNALINFDSNGKIIDSYIKGEKIEDDKKYTVAVADYIFGGGEKYVDENEKPLFQYGENVIHTGVDMRDLIIKSLKENTIKIDNKERIIFN